MKLILMKAKYVPKNSLAIVNGLLVQVEARVGDTIQCYVVASYPLTSIGVYKDMPIFHVNEVQFLDTKEEDVL